MPWKFYAIKYTAAERFTKCFITKISETRTLKFKEQKQKIKKKWDVSDCKKWDNQ